MKRLLVATLFLLLLAVCKAQPDCSYNAHSVFFGERSRMMAAPDANVIRVFMDKAGFYYPDFYINDKSLEKNCSSLKSWYEAHPKQLDTLCRNYRVDEELATAEKINRLNDSIAQSYARSINQRLAGHPTVDLLIHGFRKKAYGDAGTGSSHSTSDFGRFEQVLSGYTKKEKVLYVEIYWDGKFITPLQSYKYRGFRLFENAAIPNAQTVGLQLRRLVANIKSDTLNLITHSLGAMVGSELLFNASKGAFADEAVLPTPAQQMRICMIEPAIGADLFDAYYARTAQSNFQNADNYRLGIVFNEHDFVLLKAYNWRFVHISATPLEYGNTSLGCNYQECLPKLQQLFTDKYPHSTLAAPFDFSAVGADHRWIAYGRSDGFEKVVAFLHGH